MEHRRKVLIRLNELCTGCLSCELVCSLVKSGRISRYLARLRVTPEPEAASHEVILCRHCNPAPCLAACPVPDAMFEDEATYAIAIRDDKCVRCLACVEACPFQAIRVGPDGAPLKCDLCGGDPACVAHCPTRPEHSLPHLPLPEQSCLQFVDFTQVNTALGALRRAKR